MCAGSAAAARSAIQRAGDGAIPIPALQSLRVEALPKLMAREMIVRNHYLHSVPGGTQLAFGVLVGKRLLGALTLGVGPKNGHRLVIEATAQDCATLTRLWLSDDLPSNSESRVLGIVARLLKRHTRLGFLLSYADPAAGHVGTIYQAAGWLYVGLSSSTPLYDLGDGIPRHSRTLSYNLGSHSTRYLRSKGVQIDLIPQQPKHRYLLPLSRGTAERLTVPILPYPKRQEAA